MGLQKGRGKWCVQFKLFDSTKMDKEISPQQLLTVLSFQNDTVAKTHAVVTQAQ